MSGRGRRDRMTDLHLPLRRLARCLPGLLLLAGCASPPAPTALAQADTLIHGGLLFDGGNSDGRIADVAIRGDRILAVGPDLRRRYRATREIDATGLVVAPGFIDPHTHPDTYLRSPDPAMRRLLPWLHQGVSTIFIGIDGGGTPDVAAERAKLEAAGTGTNVAAYVGLGPVRSRVLGQDARAPDADELARMRTLVADAMCEGAFGLSAGLFYAPQSFASTDDVVALAREAAIRGGVYDTHQRDESSYSLGLMGSVEEALEIGRRAHLPVHIAHIKALGADVHGSAGAVIARIERAHAQGQRVTADQYPWLASSTSLGAALLPRWAVDGGRPALFERLDDPATAARIRDDMRDNLQRRGGADAILMTGSGWPWSARTLQQFADGAGLDPIEAALRIIGEGGTGRTGSAQRIASFNMRRDDVDLFMRQPWVLTASDGGDGHPRQHATFPEKYARFVVQDQVIDLAAFIHRSTGLTATTFGLADRGFLRPGHYADVLVFDPDAYAPKADYVRPHVLSEGVVHLFVNGVATIDAGHAAHALPGRMLQHRPPPGTCP
ncbi:amidohydrolase family protein [Luteimonas marina]|uniref:Amidohydrolase family protein n=2 Tax=Luteimonas marina TaxID=488485 RepID=A0A5C5U9G2_9GAMM|nr:amidohydrolase family protein [Luteimonas marina]